ncbi:MAG: hypothetical protein MUO78_04805, partial [candidate division Zixibacteria bacterium]|nr:hypothetical protein [candidate division Zixibacteria bacterium]
MNKLVEPVNAQERKEKKEEFIHLLEKGKVFINLFYSTLKTSLIYEPNNAAFQKQIHPLMDLVRELIEKEGELNLSTQEGYLFLNQARLRFDFENYVASRFILEFLKKLKIYKLALEAGLTQKDLQSLIYILAQIDTEDMEPFESLEKKIFEENLQNLHLEKEKESSVLEADQISLDQRKVAKKTFTKAFSMVREISQR